MKIEMFEPPVQISSRYISYHVVRRDTHEGSFEEFNSPLSTLEDQHVQHALLNRAAPSNIDLLWNQKRVTRDECLASE